MERALILLHYLNHKLSQVKLRTRTSSRSCGQIEPLLGSGVPLEEDESLHRNEQPSESMSTLRGAFIVASLSVPILLSASNISLLTTTQSAIATDLSSYSEASWFASAYLVCLAPISSMLTTIDRITDSDG